MINLRVVEVNDKNNPGLIGLVPNLVFKGVVKNDHLEHIDVDEEMRMMIVLVINEDDDYDKDNDGDDDDADDDDNAIYIIKAKESAFQSQKNCGKSAQSRHKKFATKVCKSLKKVPKMLQSETKTMFT